MKRYCSTLIFVFFIILGVARTANAGVLIEPYFGYAASVGGLDKTIGKMEDFEEYSVEIVTDYGGWDIGARAGYVYSIFMAGIDFDYRSLKATYQFGNPATQEPVEIQPEIKMMSFGIFAGVWLKNNINIRASYFPMASWNFKSMPSTVDIGGDFGEMEIPVKTGDEWTGDAFSFAIGWRVYEWVAVNFEYKKYSYNEFNDKEVDSDKRFRPSELIFTVSFPFNLFGKVDK